MEYAAKVRFTNYLPNPLRNMAQLTPRRQLVSEINNSNLYVLDFPVLDKDPNFVQNWYEFATLVADNVQSIHPSVRDDFISDWNQFAINVESDTTRFTLPDLTTIPRTLMHDWLKLDFDFLKPVYTFQTQQFYNYLSEVFNPSAANLWEDFTETIESVMDDYIHPHVNTISTIREVTADSDQQVINLTARMVGFNFRDELLNAFGKERVAAIIPMIGEAYEVASTDDFVKLIELTIGARILMEHLYSRDYINFRTFEEMQQRKGVLLNEASTGHDWFKTTHVNLYVEYEKSRYLATQINAPLGVTLLEVIEHFLPANLVLKNFGLTYAVNTPETADGLYFASAEGLQRGFQTVGDASLPQELVAHTPEPFIKALVFDNKAEIDQYIDQFVEPSASDIFSSWGRYAGKDWFPAGVALVGEATEWQYVEAEDRIECTLDTVAPVGFVSATTTKKFNLEATLQSTDRDDDMIGLTAAFEFENDTIRALHFIRTNTAVNWYASVQEGGTLYRLTDKSSPLTKGFTNPGKGGWQESGKTRIRIERDGNIVKAYTSPFGSETIDPATEIVIDLNANTRTRSLGGSQSYGYFAHSQSKASFTNRLVEGEFEDNNLYDLETDTRYYYDISSKEWKAQENYVFVHYVQASRKVVNPVTMVEYFVDGRKRIKRLSPYV